VEPESSFPFREVSTALPYHEPYESSPNSHSLFLWKYF
jgi:hypothetical protein